MRRIALILLAVALLADLVSADAKRGLALARKARARLVSGEVNEALDLLAQARVEWPDSPVLTNLAGDASVAAEELARALSEYDDAVSLAPGDVPGVSHARFNRGVTGHAQAEAALDEAGVPLDPAALPPEGAPPGLLEAIEANLPVLEQARSDFIDALDTAPDAATRESIAALNKRIDDLNEMADKLREQQQQQQDDQENQDQDQDQDDQQDQDQDQQQGDQSPEDEKQQDPQDQPPEENEDENQDEQEQDQQDPQEQPTAPEVDPTPREMSPEEMQRLIEQLEKLEERARDLEKARRARARRSVEKDW